MLSHAVQSETESEAVLSEFTALIDENPETVEPFVGLISVRFQTSSTHMFLQTTCIEPESSMTFLEVEITFLCTSLRMLDVGASPK